MANNDNVKRLSGKLSDHFAVKVNAHAQINLLTICKFNLAYGTIEILCR